MWGSHFLFCLSDQPTASALVGHFAGIAVLYLLQASLNLIGPPATCRILDDEKLEGLDLGNYLKTRPQEENILEYKITNDDVSIAPVYGTMKVTLL